MESGSQPLLHVAGITELGLFSFQEGREDGIMGLMACEAVPGHRRRMDLFPLYDVLVAEKTKFLHGSGQTSFLACVVAAVALFLGIRGV
jgi:hypothetical protein